VYLHGTFLALIAFLFVSDWISLPRWRASGSCS